jgi:hypothetical protein
MRTLPAWVPVTALTMLSLGLKLHGAFDHPLWGDEIYQRTGALDSTWWQFLTWTHACSYYNMPPLSFALQRAVVELFHTDRELAWRLPGVLAAAACVPLTYAVARRFLDFLPALVSAAACAFDFNLGWNAQIARAYPFLVFFLLAGLAAATAPASRRGLTGAVLLFSAACWSHLYAFIFLTGVAGAMWLAAARESQASPASRQLRWGATVALAANAPFFVAFQILGRLHPQTGSVPVAPDWPAALNAIRWCVGRLTWINLPLANPLLIASAISGLVWLTVRRRQPFAGAVLGGGLLVLGSLFYLVRHHDFVDPRYLLGTSLMLWLGYGAVAQIMWPARRVIVATVAGGLLAAQAWRAWNIEAYYGTIAHERSAARALASAVAYVRARLPDASVEIIPDTAFLRGTVERLGIRPSPDTAAATSRWHVWLLAGEASATRRYGDAVGHFVEKQSELRGSSETDRRALQSACASAFWTVWSNSAAGIEVRHF